MAEKPRTMKVGEYTAAELRRATEPTPVLVKVKKGEPLPPSPDERAVVPYDPLITLKKALSAAATSAGAIIGGAILTWALQDENLKFIAANLGLKGIVGVMAIPVLHAIFVAARNFVKTRWGVYYERVEPAKQA